MLFLFMGSCDFQLVVDFTHDNHKKRVGYLVLIVSAEVLAVAKATVTLM